MYVKMSSITFNPSWMTDPQYSSWIAKVPKNPHQARCTACNKDFNLGNMGIGAIKSHMKGKKHLFRTQSSSGKLKKLSAKWTCASACSATTAELSAQQEDTTNIIDCPTETDTDHTEATESSSLSLTDSPAPSTSQSREQTQPKMS